MKKLIFILFMLFIYSSAFGATLTKTIGTTSRDYSTIQAWEDDLDDGTNAANDATAYQSGDDAVGEVYNDSVFDESVTIDGGGTVGLNSIKLTVPEGQRHDGVAASAGGTPGSRIVGTVVRTLRATSLIDITISWLEWDYNGKAVAEAIYLNTDGAHVITISHLLLHDIATTGVLTVVRIWDPVRILNCIGYDFLTTSASFDIVRFVYITSGTSDEAFILNSTFVGLVNDNGTGRATGIEVDDSTTTKGCNNTISMDVGGTTSGIIKCFSLAVNNRDEYNMDSDGSLPDTGNNLRNQVSSEQFVSVVNGSEDFHLKSGADAIDAGTDLVTTPTGVNIDIDNRDRDAEGDTWDMGADEFVGVAPSGAPQVIMIMGM